MRRLRIMLAGFVLAASAILGVAAALGAFSSAQTLSGANEQSLAPHVVADAQGNSVVAWTLLDTIFDPRCTDQTAPCTIQARERSNAGALGPIQTVSDPTQQAYPPQIAM